MSVTRSTALVFLLLTGACASTPGDRGSREPAKKALRGGVAEFQVISYDGEEVKSRVLLGAAVDPLVIDGRLIESSDVELENFRTCDNKARLAHIIDDRSAPPPRQDQIITVRPGYWYGRKVSFWPFSEHEKGPGPECFEAELVVRAIDGRDAAKLPIRVVRTDRPPAALDGGTEEPKPPPSDAGAP